jgi:hypothetical protein
MHRTNSKPAPSINDAIEALRKKIPEAQTMSEANGVSIPDKSGVYFELTRLEAAAKTVPCKTFADCKLLMQYLEDEDLKIRYIAAAVLERTLKAHPLGMPVAEIDGKDAVRHRKLVDSFQAKINEHFNPSAKKTKQQQPLALGARLDNRRIEIGTELAPTVSLRNVSGKPLKLVYGQPSIVVPEIWDVASNERVLNAPTYVYDVARRSEETTLAPNEELILFPVPVLTTNQSLPAARSDHLRGYWAPLPGNFALKYSVQVKDFLPSGTGELHAEDLEITVVDPAKELVGVLFFEAGRGYYLAMGTKGGKSFVWLQISKNKIVVQKLASLVGSEVKVAGCLQRMPTNVSGSIPAGALYLSDCQIK